MDRPAGPLQVLKNSNYRVYFIGQLISMSGTWMQSIAQSWLVYRLSHSGTWLGVITFAVHMTAFVLSPVAGVVADQFDRRKILVATQVVAIAQALCLGALLLSGHVQLWHVVALAAVLGCVNAFDITTRQAFAVDMVGKADLTSAIVLNAVVINVSRVVGPAAAGFLIGVVGEGWCFLLNGLSTLPVLVGLLLMRIERPNRAGAPRNSVVGNMAEGWAYALRHRVILRLLVISASVCFFGSPFVVLLPVFAKSVLGGDANTLAWLTGVMGLGAVLGALGVARRTNVTHIRRQIVRYTILWGVGIAVLGASKSLALSLVTMFYIGYVMLSLFPTLNNAIQQLVHDGMRGRVMSLYTMSFLGTMPVGSLAIGWLSDKFGAPHVAMVSGGLTASIGLALIPDVFWGSACAEVREPGLQVELPPGAQPEITA